MSALRRHLTEPVVTGRVFRELALLVLAIPFGIAGLVILVVGWSLGLGLAVTLVGLPVLLGLAFVVRGQALIERRIAAALVRARVADPVRPVWRGSLGGSLWAWLRDPVAWREQAHMVARFALGIPLAIVAIAVPWAGGAMLFAVVYYRFGGGIDIGAWRVDTLAEAILLIAPGAAVLVLSVPVIGLCARLWIAVAEGLLGRPGAPVRAGAPIAVHGRRPGPAARRALRVHGALWFSLNLVLVVIWVSTTPTGYFWPAWTLLAPGLVLAMHTLFVLAPVVLPRMRPSLLGLVRHAGAAGLLELFLIGVWAITTPGQAFWPVWSLLGLFVPVLVHAIILMAGGPAERDEMAERIDALTTTRAGAVDAQAAELQRIERDLHDGAQARLVALAMDLGMARERLEEAPEEARRLVAGAHEEAKRAIVELRDLARGIHPAVLTDRGLDAALGSLAGTSRIPVDLDLETGGRMEAPLEAVAYFTVAEALVNAAKHSGARHVRVGVRRAEGRLVIRVADDGAGGADASGQGLTGLRRRIEAHDGRLSVDSPRGHGTLLTAELPCGS